MGHFNPMKYPILTLLPRNMSVHRRSTSSPIVIESKNKINHLKGKPTGNLLLHIVKACMRVCVNGEKPQCSNINRFVAVVVLEKYHYCPQIYFRVLSYSQPHPSLLVLRGAMFIYGLFSEGSFRMTMTSIVNTFSNKINFISFCFVCLCMWLPHHGKDNSNKQSTYQ